MFVWKQASYKEHAGGCETTPIFGPGSLVEGREEESSPEKEHFEKGEQSPLLVSQPQHEPLIAQFPGGDETEKNKEGPGNPPTSKPDTRL